MLGSSEHAVWIEAKYPEFTKRQRIELRPGAESVDFETEIRSWTGRNQLLRVEFPFDFPGARPVFQTAAAVIGRPFAREIDTNKDPWTLDNAAHAWGGLGSVCALEVESRGKTVHRVPLAVGEIVFAGDASADAKKAANRAAEALVKCGVTTTITAESDRRYGDLAFDTNVPDFRLRIGADPARPGARLTVDDHGGDPELRLDPKEIEWFAGELAVRRRLLVSEVDARLAKKRSSRKPRSPSPTTASRASTSPPTGKLG